MPLLYGAAVQHCVVQSSEAQQPLCYAYCLKQSQLEEPSDPQAELDRVIAEDLTAPDSPLG